MVYDIIDLKLFFGVIRMEDNKVAVLLEDLRAQFGVFGEGLQLLDSKVDKGFQEVNEKIDSLQTELANFKDENRQEHQQLQQAIAELDTEVVKLKRVK